MGHAFTWSVETEHPIATASLDHLHPFGTATDNHTSDTFCAKLCELLKFTTPPAVLDIGCAGGGMIGDMWRQGWDAVGIEGSDYSQKAGRAEWATLDGICLFTCDATKPFTIKRSSEDGCFPVRFHVITAWEVLEHIETDDLPQFLDNVKSHLLPGGYFICSIASFASPHDGVELHRTILPICDWKELLMDAGFDRDRESESHFEGQWVRTSTANFVLRLTNAIGEGGAE